MPFRGIVDPEHLVLLTTAVDDFCREAGVDPVSPERDEIASVVVILFENGTTTADELKAALRLRLGRNRRPH